MSDSIDAAVIKRTQETLGKYVKKPVLSEKLLKKPPFRFLHDVFNAVIKETGCFEGLYTKEELNYETITDRDSKMKFLQKMIDVIKITTNEPLTVRTSKIVAGHEPEKTNELLQMIGIVIEKKIDWKGAVEKINNDESTPSPQSKSKEKSTKDKKTIDKPAKVTETKKVESSKAKSKTETKEKIKSRDTKDTKEKVMKKTSKSTDGSKVEEKKIKSKTSSKEPSKKVSPEKIKKDTTQNATPQKHILKEASSNEDTLKNDERVELTQNINPIAENQENNIPPNEREERPASKRAKEILLSAAAEEVKETNSRRSSGGKRSSEKTRKSSEENSKNRDFQEINAQVVPEPAETLKTVTEEQPTEALVSPIPKSPPNSEVKRESTFVRENSKETTQNPPRPRTSLRPPSARPASARPGAPRRRDKNIEIILQPNDQIKLSGISVKLETFNSELEDDGENLVIIENANTDETMQGNLSKSEETAAEDSLQQGHLVQQILETQKELVQNGSPDSDQKQDYDKAKLNSRQSSARQMNSLRDVIQNLTKSVNPLGKLMDFIPEDIDAMQLELTMWRDTYNQASVELKKEKSLTETVTEPMKNQLVTIEANIKEYKEMIDECRAKILQNAEKIQKLLTTQ